MPHVENISECHEQMKEIANENLSVSRSELDRDEAINLFDKRGEKYKVEIIKEIKTDLN